jgi:hypothetical protein
MPMASIDDLYRDVSMLLDGLVRVPPDGLTAGMGQVGSFPGLVPRTYHVAQQSRDAAVQALSTIREAATLLTAVNEVTLGRIEGEVNDLEETTRRVDIAVSDARASSDQALGRIEAVLADVMEFLPTVRADMTDLAAKLDTIVVQRQQDMASLDAKLDGVMAAIQALPR